MDKDSEDAVQVDGKPVTVTKKFTTPAATNPDGTVNGTIDIPFTLNGTSLAGKSVVVYEYLYQNGTMIADHDNIDDEGQTIYMPKIGTRAVNNATGDQIAMAEGTLTIKDLQENAKLTLVSATSIVEGGAHDVILKDSVNGAIK